MWSSVEVTVDSRVFSVSASTQTAGQNCVLVCLPDGITGIAQVLELYTCDGNYLSTISYYYAASDLTEPQSAVMALRYGEDWRKHFEAAGSAIGLLRVRHTTEEVSVCSFLGRVKVLKSRPSALPSSPKPVYFEVSHVDFDFALLIQEAAEWEAIEDGRRHLKQYRREKKAFEARLRATVTRLFM